MAEICFCGSTVDSSFAKPKELAVESAAVVVHLISCLHFVNYPRKRTGSRLKAGQESWSKSAEQEIDAYRQPADGDVSFNNVWANGRKEVNLNLNPNLIICSQSRSILQEIVQRRVMMEEVKLSHLGMKSVVGGGGERRDGGGAGEARSWRQRIAHLGSE